MHQMSRRPGIRRYRSSHTAFPLQGTAPGLQAPSRTPADRKKRSSSVTLPPVLISHPFWQTPLGLNVRRLLAVAGPGLVVMFADTDAGSIVTAAQSGAQWGYHLLALQVILIPILYIVQELTLRLGLVTGRGHGELIRAHFGRGWAWVSISTLLLACVGALISEFSGIAGVGALFGIPTWLSVGSVIAFLTYVVWTGTYRRVERIALALGLFELIFAVVAWQSHPHMREIAQEIRTIPLGNSHFLYLAAANVGAVIMPWMVFYQQSAVVDKRLAPHDLKEARIDTAWGAVLTQIVMACVLIAVAATIGAHNSGTHLDSVQQIAGALVPFLGETTGEVFFALGMVGAALVAAIVVSLTAAWGLGELTGYHHSLEKHPREAPWFYGVYTASLLGGGLIVMSGINLVQLSIGVEVMNALLLPIVLGLLYLLALKALPHPYRLHGWYAILVGVVITATALFGLYAGGFTTIAGLVIRR
jgi:Mn2+/Fe2+ NRAMP family transporter